MEERFAWVKASEASTCSLHYDGLTVRCNMTAVGACASGGCFPVASRKQSETGKGKTQCQMTWPHNCFLNQAQSNNLFGL